MNHKQRILIVDDEKNIRTTILRCLDSMQYESVTAIDGEEALKILRSERFDLMLLDLKLPGMSGLELIRALQQEGIAVKTIIISAHGTVETAVESMKAGALDFIEKPFTPDELRQLVLKYLQE